MKKVLFVLLTGILVLRGISLSAQSFIVEGIRYEVIADSTVTVTAIPDFEYYGKVMIPAKVSWEDSAYTVVAISSEAFTQCLSLTSVTIPDTVEKIGESAFRDCKNLKSIVLPEGLTELESEAFARCDELQKIVIPNHVKKIPYDCFSYCISLKSVTIGTAVEVIEPRAFEGCSLIQAITIPSNVKTVKDFAFTNCSKLTKVNFADKEHTNYRLEAFSNTPYYNANSTRGRSTMNDPRFKVKSRVIY